MLRSHWIAAVALGLTIALTEVGYCQENPANDSPSPAETSDEQAEPLLPAIGIRIIESDEQASSRQAAEERAEQRELNDLAAQQGMNEATQQMAVYALLQTILIAVGTGALIYTLHLTRQANRAAQEGVAVTRYLGKVQTEAYLAVTNLSIGHGIGHQIVRQMVDTGFAPISLSLANRGQSPAMIEASEAHVNILVRGEIRHSSKLPTIVEQTTVEAGGSGHLRADIPNHFLVGDGFTLLEDAKAIVRISVDYRTRFKDLDRITYESQMTMACTQPINPEIDVRFQPDPLTPPRFNLERIEKSNAQYERA